MERATQPKEGPAKDISRRLFGTTRETAQALAIRQRQPAEKRIRRDVRDHVRPVFDSRGLNKKGRTPLLDPGLEGSSAFGEARVYGRAKLNSGEGSRDKRTGGRGNRSGKRQLHAVASYTKTSGEKRGPTSYKIRERTKGPVLGPEGGTGMRKKGGRAKELTGPH